MLAKVKACRLWLVFCGTYKRLLLNRTHHCTAPQPLYGEKSLRRSVALWVESKTGASWQVACSSCAASAIGDKNIAVPRKQKQKKRRKKYTARGRSRNCCILAGIARRNTSESCACPERLWQVLGYDSWVACGVVGAECCGGWVLVHTHTHTTKSVGYMQQCDKSNKKCQGIPVATDITLELQVSSSWQTPLKRG